MHQWLVEEAWKSSRCGPLPSHYTADLLLSLGLTPPASRNSPFPPFSELLGSAPWSLSPFVPQVPFCCDILVTWEMAPSAGPRASVDTDPTLGYLHPSVLESAGVSPCSSILLAKHQLDHRERHAEAFSGLPPHAAQLVAGSPRRQGSDVPGSGFGDAAHGTGTTVVSPPRVPWTSTACPPVGWCRGVAGVGVGATGGVMWQSVTLCPGQSLPTAGPDAFCAVRVFPSHSF